MEKAIRNILDEVDNEFVIIKEAIFFYVVIRKT